MKKKVQVSILTLFKYIIEEVLFCTLKCIGLHLYKKQLAEFYFRVILFTFNKTQVDFYVIS